MTEATLPHRYPSRPIAILIGCVAVDLAAREPGGHTTPVGAFRQAADWIDRQLHPQAAP